MSIRGNWPGVVCDPQISFGEPTLAGFGVRTAVLAEKFYAGDSIEELAKDYEIPKLTVQNAIRYEHFKKIKWVRST